MLVLFHILHDVTILTHSPFIRVCHPENGWVILQPFPSPPASLDRISQLPNLWIFSWGIFSYGGFFPLGELFPGGFFPRPQPALRCALCCSVENVVY